MLLSGQNLYLASETMLNVVNLTAPTGSSLPPVVASQAPAPPPVSTAPPPLSAPPPPSAESKIRVERGLIAVTLGGGSAIVRGSAHAVAGSEPLTVTVTNTTLGTVVPVVAVAADGSFQATISAAPGDRIELRAINGSGEAASVDLGEIPGGGDRQTNPNGKIR